MNGVITGFVGAIIEAWAQLRIGKLRVMLSLIGVAVAVAAMTFIIAFGQVTASVTQDLMEKWSGRPGIVQIMVTPTSQSSDYSGSASGDMAFASTMTEASNSNDALTRVHKAQQDFVERYNITHWSTNYNQNVRLNLGQGPTTVQATVVSASYGLLHPITIAEGRWFNAEDADDFSPSIIVSKSVLTTLGLEHLTAPVQVTGLSPAHTTYTIVGVMPEDRTGGQECMSGPDGDMVCHEVLNIYVLNEPFERLLPPTAEKPTPTFEVWAGVGRDQELMDLARTYFNGVFGHGSTQVFSNDFGQTDDISRGFTAAVTGAGVFIMILGALGLINISLVTVRQRIHEIGVRRSFGATSRRIFFSIMMESVVATVVAGVVGIIMAIIAMRVVPIDRILMADLPTTPPFPMSAAIIGLIAASGVGALAGIIPAIVAVRIRPIDAIRI